MLFFNYPFRNKASILDDATLCDITNVCNTEKEISINCICDNKDWKDIAVRFARHDYYLIYILNGVLNIELNNIKATMSAGNLIIIKPETEYYYYTKKNSTVAYMAIHITGSKVEEYLNGFSIPVNKICNCGYINNMINYWKRLQREFILYDKFFDQTTVAILTQILARFSRAINSTDIKNFLTQSVTYIHDNFQKKISIKYLADLEEISESYYRTVFKQIFGKTPGEYITFLRLTAAAEYLEITNKSLAEIAALVGYNDEFYLGKMFKKEFGISPGKYRKLNNQ